MKIDSKKGFTVVELLAVVVVIAIIIVIATASIFSLMKQAREKQYETNLDSMGTATRLFGDDAKNGLSKINNALVYKDKNNKTWKIGCKAEGLDKNCCVSMTMLRDMGYLKITEEDMCGDNKPCLNYNANIIYRGNSMTVDLFDDSEACEVIKFKIIYHSVEKINSGEELTLEQLCEYNKPCLLKTSPPEYRAKYPGHKVINWEDRRGYTYETGKEVDLTNRTTTDVFDLFANWKNNEFTFTYHGNTSNAGTMTPSHHTYEDGSSLKQNVYTKIGYSYLYWNDKDDGSGRKYDDMEHVSTNDFDDGANIDIYAQWKPNDYNVTFDANNGTNLSFSSKVVTFDSAYGDLPTVSRIGYTFKGWWTAKTGGSEIKTTTIVKTPDHHTLYAHWQANTYTVTFNGNSCGTPNPASKTVTYDSTYGTLASISKTGYTFKGWWTAASGGTEVKASTLVQITDAQTLYAHCTPNPYTITLTNTNATTAGTTSVTATFDSATLSSGITNPVRKYTIKFSKGTTGATLSSTQEISTWTFTGWWTETSGGTNIIGTDGKLISNRTGYTNASGQWVKAGNATLYAQWTDGGITVPSATWTGWSCSFGTVTNPPTANKTYTASCADITKPAISCTKTTINSTAGVTVSCTCTDGQSGVVKCADVAVTATSSTTKEKTGLKTNTTYYAIDKAGNQASTTISISSQRQKRTASCSSGETCSDAGCATRSNCKCSGYYYSGSCTCEQGSGSISRSCTADNCSATCKSYNPGAYSSGGSCSKNCRSWYSDSSCSCTSYNSSISKCGCASWGGWSGWSNVSSCSSGESSDHSSKTGCRTLYK